MSAPNTPTLCTRDVPPRAAFALEQAGVHPLLARLFAARGVRSADELDDGLARLLPPCPKGEIDEESTTMRWRLHKDPPNMALA